MHRTTRNVITASAANAGTKGRHNAMTKQETIDAFFARFKRIVDKTYSVYLQKNGYMTMEKHKGDP